MALGATRSYILLMVCVQCNCTRVLSIGIAVGLLACFAYGRLIADQLVLPTYLDPMAMTAGVTVVVAVEIVAAPRHCEPLLFSN
jgi:predicted lysophospholipase L1 biosynthesis ABC-type transport system permease subunit